MRRTSPLETIHSGCVSRTFKSPRASQSSVATFRRDTSGRQRQPSSFQTGPFGGATAKSPLLTLLLLLVMAPPVLPFAAAAAATSASTMATPSWNVSRCPLPCHCQLQPAISDLLHRQGTSTRTVNCSHLKLTTLPSDLPKETETLLLAGNALAELYDHVPELLELRELDVTDNRVRSLGRGYIFHNLSGLVHLSLAKNELTSLAREVFGGLAGLQVLVLAENKIAYIEDQAFNGLSGLLTLDLGRNQLTALYPEWFYGLGRLRQLYLYENRVHLVNSATFRPLRRLQHLSLHGNRISHVSSDAFWGLEQLETLHLERNNMAEAPGSPLQRYLPALRHLYVSGNPMPVLRAGDFSHMAMLEELVANNLPSLKLIEAGAFTNLTRLTSLQLRDCSQLSYLDPAAFVNLTALRSLQLQNDRLMAFARQTAKSLPVGTEISLRGNPLLCNCNVRWIRVELELAERNASRVRLLEPEQLLCDAPEHAHGVAVRLLDPQTPAATASGGNGGGALPAQCAPTVVTGLLETRVERRLGEPLSLDCRSLGNPEPRLRWNVPGGKALWRSTNEVRRQVRESGTLQFYHVKEEDAGNYTCVATNTVGTSEATVVVSIQPIDIHLFATAISSTFITVVWNGTARTSFPQFQIRHRPLPDNQVRANLNSGGGGGNEAASAAANGSAEFVHETVSPFHRSHMVNNLRPDRVYEICLAFQYPDGHIVHISCTRVRTQDASYMLQGIHRTSNVAVAAVLGVLVVMVMVICVVTVAARKYRQRQYVCPDKPIIHRMSHIPLENLYSPLMSNAGQ